MNGPSHPIRFRYVNQAVGILVLVTVAVFITGMLFSGQIQRLINPGVQLKVLLPSDGLFGLSNGSDVEILGTKAGDVRDIIISPDQQMHADVRIKREMMPFVRRDSTAMIQKRWGVAGDAYIKISRGFGEPLDWEYAVITASVDRAPTENIGELIDELRNKIFPVIDDAQKAIQAFVVVAENLQDPDGDMQKLLANVNAISGKVSRGEGAVGRLISDDTLVVEIETLVAQLSENLNQIEPAFAELEATVRNVSEITAVVNEQTRGLPDVTGRVESILTTLEGMMTDLERTTPQLPRIAGNIGEATDSLPVLLIQMQQVMEELERLTRQLQSHWLLGGASDDEVRAGSRISPLEVRP